MTPAAAKPKTITLADLSDEDRKALLEQAREEAKHNPRDVEGYAELSDPERAFRELMDARDHIKGCPVAEGTVLGRVEAFNGRRPPNPALGEPERMLGVFRCCECGGSTVREEPLEALLERTLATSREPAGATAGGAAGPPDNDL